MDFSEPLVLNLAENVPLTLQPIQAGTFRMGQRGGFADEQPAHRVTMPKPFFLGTFPVTQIQYRIMAKACLSDLQKIDGNKGIDPSHWQGNNLPVELVSWDDAQCVIRWLNEESTLVPEGFQASLPTEAQWEYACRADTQTDYWSGNGDQALLKVGWCRENASETHLVGEKQRPNPWGLHDMHGNVAEWCLDYFDYRRYSRAVDGQLATVMDDPAQLQFAEPNANEVAIVALLQRVIDDDRSLNPEDHAVLRDYKTYAKFFSGGKHDSPWITEVIPAIETALSKGEWPNTAISIASAAQPVFVNRIKATANPEDPARVLRGGAWSSTPTHCRSASRYRFAPGNRFRSVGFRLAVVPVSGAGQQQKASV